MPFADTEDINADHRRSAFNELLDGRVSCHRFGTGRLASYISPETDARLLIFRQNDGDDRYLFIAALAALCAFPEDVVWLLSPSWSNEQCLATTCVILLYIVKRMWI